MTTQTPTPFSKTNTFNQQCYDLLTRVPLGRVTTYAQIAKALNTNAWRAVGNAMAKNPNLITVPCHRVVKSDATLGGYALGLEQKIILLQHEGLVIQQGKIQNFTTVLFKFDDESETL